MSHTFEESDHEPTPLFEGNAPPPPRRPWTRAAAFTKMASVIMLAAIVTMAVILWTRTQHDYDKSPAAAQGSEPVSMQAEDEDSACAETCTMNGKTATCRETMAEVLRQSGQRVVQCGAVQQTVDQECPQCSACPVHGSREDIRKGVQGSYTMNTETWESCKSVQGGLNPCRVQSDPVEQWEAACKRGDWLPGVRFLEPGGSGSNLIGPDALAYMVSESHMMRNSDGDMAEVKRFARAPNALFYYLKDSNGTEYKWETFFDDLDVHCRTGQTTPDQDEFEDVSKLLDSKYCSVTEIGCVASRPWPTVPEYPYYVKNEWIVKQAGFSETEEQSHRTITMYEAPDGTPVMFEIHSAGLSHMVMVITEYSPGEDADMPPLPSPPCPQVDEQTVFPDAIPKLNSPYGPCVDASKEVLRPLVPMGLANNGLYYDVGGGSPPVQWYNTNNDFPIRRLQSIGGMANESRELLGPSTCQLPAVKVPLVGEATFKGCGPGPLCILPNGVSLKVYGKTLESFCLKVCSIKGTIEAGGWVSCDMQGFGGKPACANCGELFAKGCLDFSVNPLAALEGTGIDWLVQKLTIFSISLCAGGSIGDADWFRMFIGGSSFVNVVVAQVNADTQLTYAAQAKNMKCGHQLLSWNGLTIKIEVGINLFFVKWMKTVLNKQVVGEKCLWSTDMDPKDECAPYADQCGGCKTCSCDDAGCTSIPAITPTPAPAPPKQSIRDRMRERQQNRRNRRRNRRR